MSESSLSVGLEISVSAAVPATYNKAGYEALSWTVVSEAESVPEFGGDAQIAEFIPLATGVVDKAKGSINYGSTTLPLRRKITDAGQVALASGFDGVNRNVVHSIKLSHPDHGALYFTCVIGSFTYNPGDANSFNLGSVRFDIKTKPVAVDDVFTVLFLAVGNGTIVGEASQLVVSGSSTSTVYAAPDSGKTFTQWSDANTDNPRTLTNVLADTTLTATFSA